MSETKSSRRRFLEVIAVSAVVPFAAACSSGGGGIAPAKVGTVAAGNVSALPVGSLRAIAGVPVCIGHDTQGVYAMTLTCTHAGCDISQGTVAASGLVCKCHGSSFDANGAVTNGPAADPLQHFAVSIDAQGLLLIHGDMNVDASTRLMV